MHKEFEEKIAEYLDGRLSPEERAEFELQMERSPEARESMRAYREVMALESKAANLPIPAAPKISSLVMDRISAESRSSGMVGSVWVNWRLYMERALGINVREIHWLIVLV